jgi:hypothetical protein
MIVTAIKGLIGIIFILFGWLLVQTAWRRVFPDTPIDEDVLAGRLGCHDCSRQTTCDGANRGASKTALQESNQSQG